MEFLGDPFNPEDTEAFVEEMRAQPEIEKLRTAILLLSDAMKGIIRLVNEHDAHLHEHHAVLNGHARALETLEALMIGGNDEAPPA